MQDFPYWEMGEGEFPPTSQKFANSLHQKSTPPAPFPPKSPQTTIFKL